MELDAEGGLGLVGEAGLPGGQELFGGNSLGGAKRDLGKSFQPGWEIIGNSQLRRHPEQ